MATETLEENQTGTIAVSTTSTAPASIPKYLELPMDAIQGSKDNPRQLFDDDDLAELAQSIRTVGLLEPIIVRPLATDDFSDRYEIIAGERRFRACDMLGLPTIVAIVREATDGEAVEIALIENLTRKDINPMEEARGYALLMDLKYTQEKIAERVGRKQSDVAKRVGLLKLPDSVQVAIAGGRISATHGVALCSIAEYPDQVDLFTRHTVAEKWSVAELTNRIISFKGDMDRAAKEALKQEQPELFPETPKATETTVTPETVTPTTTASPASSSPGYKDRPEGQGLTWFQWCQAYGLAGGADDWTRHRTENSNFWQAYQQGLKPSEYRKQMEKAVADAAKTDVPAPVRDDIQAGAGDTTDSTSTDTDEEDGYEITAAMTGASAQPEAEKVTAPVSTVAPVATTSADGIMTPLSLHVLKALTDLWNKDHADQQSTMAERLETILLTRAAAAGMDTEALEAEVNGVN